jgi:hypothetical protein
MEIILKKSKITNSILNQTLIANVIDLKTADVLGFCVIKNQKWIVLYKSATNELKKYLMFKEVVAETDHSDKPTWVKVNFGGIWVSKSYQTENEEGSKEFVKLMNTIKHKAENCGQFFL